MDDRENSPRFSQGSEVFFLRSLRQFNENFYKSFFQNYLLDFFAGIFPVIHENIIVLQML